jgi:hypothetical protein
MHSAQLAGLVLARGRDGEHLLKSSFVGKIIDADRLFKFFYLINVEIALTVALHQDRQKLNSTLAPLPPVSTMRSSLKQYVRLGWCHFFLEWPVGMLCRHLGTSNANLRKGLATAHPAVVLAIGKLEQQLTSTEKLTDRGRRASATRWLLTAWSASASTISMDERRSITDYHKSPAR